MDKTGLEEAFVYKYNKKMKRGFTTGTCAAAAAKGAALMLFLGEKVDTVSLETPGGYQLSLPVLHPVVREGSCSCAIQKDSGDDPDVTNGILIYVTLEQVETPGIFIQGGDGIGRITKPGLEQPPGEWAINQVPRRMILDVVEEIAEEADYQGGIRIVVSAPGGEEIAKKTFNPRLGIERGISILGTTGIVEPMSEAALIDSIRLELSMQKKNGVDFFCISPGNYGEQFAKEQIPNFDGEIVKCSNYIGETLDLAVELEAKGVFLIGHIGKLIKLAGGIMNTHSRSADCRMELLASLALLAGADGNLGRQILLAVTTDEGINLLKQGGILEPVMQLMVERIVFYLKKRSYEKLEIKVIVFSNVHGLLASSEEISQKENNSGEK